MSTLSAALEAGGRATPGPWMADHSVVWSDYDEIADSWDSKFGITQSRANATIIAAAPDALDWIAKALPFLKLDLERRRFIDYDDSENKAYGDRDIAALTALIAKAEGVK